VSHFAEQKWEAQRANQKPGRAARLICFVKDINFIDVNRLDCCKQSHLRYALLATVFTGESVEMVSLN